MGKILALDWDRRQLRFVLAVVGRRSVKVLAASAMPMAMVQGEDDPQPRPDLVGTLKAKLGRKATRLPALVGVDRASIETLPLTLPPATDAELPELVLNQAMRESPSVTEDTPLDFLPLTDEVDGPREVLAVMLAPEAMREIKQACSKAGVKPARMLMRPYASASLYLRGELAASREPTLLVNLVGDEVDLTVAADGKIIFTRTARIPHDDDPSETARRVSAEIGRTLMVAMQHQIGDQSVSRVCLFGPLADHPGVAESVSEQFDLPTVELDPFDAVDIGRKAMPEQSGSFAPLLGMLLDEAHGAKHAIDFLNPRKVPQPRSLGRVYAAVAALLLIGAGYAWYTESRELKKLDTTVAELKQLHDERLALAKRARYQMQIVNSLRAWNNSDINWLDELRDLTGRFPSSQDMVVLRMSLTPGRGGRGAMVTFSGMARDPKIIIQMEEMMRARGHTVSSKRLQQRGPKGQLAWSFDATVTLRRRNKAAHFALYQAEQAPARQVARSRPPPAAVPQPVNRQGGQP